MRKLAECLSDLSGGAAGAVIKNPKCLHPQILSFLAGLENDPYEKLLRKLANGDSIWYMSDL